MHLQCCGEDSGEHDREAIHHVKHLAEIKYIFPEVLGLELVSLKDADTSKIIRDVKVILLQIRPAEASAGDGSKGKERYSTVELSRKEELRAKLLAHSKAYPGAEDVPEADVPQHSTVTAADKELVVSQVASPKSSFQKFGGFQTTRREEESSATGVLRVYELPAIRRVEVPFDVESICRW